MRRTGLIVVGLFAVAAISWAVWPREAPVQVDRSSAPVIDFAPVDVRATGAQQGLTMTGVVKDPSGTTPTCPSPRSAVI